MPNISLPNGKVLYVTTYEYYFQLQEEDMDDFFQSCMADDLGSYLEDPFCKRRALGRIEMEDIPEIEEPPIEEEWE